MNEIFIFVSREIFHFSLLLGDFLIIELPHNIFKVEEHFPSEAHKQRSALISNLVVRDERLNSAFPARTA